VKKISEEISRIKQMIRLVEKDETKTKISDKKDDGQFVIFVSGI